MKFLLVPLHQGVNKHFLEGVEEHLERLHSQLFHIVMKHNRVLGRSLELPNVVSEEPTLAGLGLPGEEHEVTCIDILAVDIFEGEHKLLDHLVVAFVRQEWELVISSDLPWLALQLQCRGCCPLDKLRKKDSLINGW